MFVRNLLKDKSNLCSQIRNKKFASYTHSCTMQLIVKERILARATFNTERYYPSHLVRILSFVCSLNWGRWKGALLRFGRQNFSSHPLILLSFNSGVVVAQLVLPQRDFTIDCQPYQKGRERVDWFGPKLWHANNCIPPGQKVQISALLLLHCLRCIALSLEYIQYIFYSVLYPLGITLIILHESVYTNTKYLFKIPTWDLNAHQILSFAG